MHDICVRAGLSVGSFYYHFDDKVAITLRILEREHAVVMSRIEAMDLRRVGSIEETLSELVNGPSSPLYRALREAAETERRVSELEAELRRAVQDALVAAIGHARHGGEGYRLKPRSIAWSFLAMMRAALADAHDSDGSLAREVAEIVDHAIVGRQTGEAESA